jgi:hypothetical protein
MRAICLVELIFYSEYKFIVEQLFTSLLQTYRSYMVANTNNRHKTIKLLRRGFCCRLEVVVIQVKD